MQDAAQTGPEMEHDSSGLGFFDLLTILVRYRRPLLIAPVALGALALGATYLVKPTFTAKTTFLPPQQQGATASALASISSIAGLMGASAGIKTPGDQYVALLQSATVADHVIDNFHLMDLYKTKYRFEARQALGSSVRILLGKKDGLITIEADSQDPDLAANIANEYVAGLRELTSHLQLTEAQQRRAFYQAELERTSKQLTAAQTALQNSGFNAGALKTEPKSAADAYARLQAALTDGEVKLESLRRTLTDSSPEVQQQLGVLASLREQLQKAGQQTLPQSDADYIGRYRAFKYQETLFDLFSKQFEMAKLDESHDDTVIQVIDVATPPEHKSAPKRAMTAIATALLSGAALAFVLIFRALWRQAAEHPVNTGKVARLRAAWGRQIT